MVRIVDFMKCLQHSPNPKSEICFTNKYSFVDQAAVFRFLITFGDFFAFHIRNFEIRDIPEIDNFNRSLFYLRIPAYAVKVVDCFLGIQYPLWESVYSLPVV